MSMCMKKNCGGLSGFMANVSPINCKRFQDIRFKHKKENKYITIFSIPV